jgi:hypothetical protein
MFISFYWTERHASQKIVVFTVTTVENLIRHIFQNREGPIVGVSLQYFLKKGEKKGIT